jgi:hypothetical protein
MNAPGYFMRKWRGMARLAPVPTNWTFTDLQGRVYSNATLRTATPAGITFLWGPGHPGKIDFTNLPEDVRKMFHYDKAKAYAFAADQAADRARSAADARIRGEFNNQKARILATADRNVGNGDVLQVVKDGVLLNSRYPFGTLVMLWQYPSAGLTDGQRLIVEQARAILHMARANERRNGENKAGSTARRTRMLLADWQEGRQIKKPGQTGGHRQEREERRLAQGQTPEACVCARPPRCTAGGGFGAKNRRINPDRVGLIQSRFLSIFICTSCKNGGN